MKSAAPPRSRRERPAVHPAKLVALLSGAMQEGFAFCELLSDRAGRPCDCRLLEVNAAFTRLTGLAAGETCGRTLRELLPKAGSAAWLAACARAVAERTPARLEAGFPGRAGTLEARVAPQGRGRFLLLLEETCLQRLLEGSPEAAAAVDDGKGAVVEVNQALLALTGRAHGELIGRPPTALLGTGWDGADGREVRVATPDGTVREVEIHTRPLELDGRKWTLVFLRDLTDERRRGRERESEAQFRRVVERAPIPIIVYAEDGRVVVVSRAVTRLTGYRRREIRTFEDWTRMVYAGEPGQVEEVRRRVSWMFETGGSISQVERVITTRSGRKRVWLFAEAKPHRFGGGVRYHTAIAVDITERKEAEQALQKVNERLERRVSERTAVAERRARELQMLAVQLIEAEERERQRIGAVLHDDLQQILAAAKRKLFWLKEVPDDLAGLMEEAIQKARRLSYELSPSVLRYAGFTAALEWLARQVKEQHGLEVSLETGAWKDEAAEPVKVALFRSVHELLFNVVKHAGVLQASVSLSGGRGRLKVTVSDAGQGFDPRKLKPGDEFASGVGLVSIRERIRSIGGGFAVRSAPGCGSRITLTVPYKLKSIPATVPAGGAEPRARGETPVAARRPSKRAASLDARYRLLFVDDHKVVREGLIAMMENQPDILVVGAAADGREAVELTRELLPDVIVMDVSMPEMDGIEATRCIKAEWPGVRIIGLSMFDEKEVIERMIQAGAETCISKTSSSSSILQLIYGLTPAGARPAGGAQSPAGPTPVSGSSRTRSGSPPPGCS